MSSAREMLGAVAPGRDVVTLLGMQSLTQKRHLLLARGKRLLRLLRYCKCLHLYPLLLPFLFYIYITCRNIDELSSFVSCRDDAAKKGGVFVDEVSSPQNENREGKAKVVEDEEAQQLMDELAATHARQAELMAQLRDKYAGGAVLLPRRMRS